MDAPLVPNEVSPTQKKLIWVGAALLVCFVVVVVILSLVAGVEPNKSGFIIVSIALTLFMISVCTLLNWLRQDKLDDKVKWVAVLQAVSLVVMSAAILAVIVAPSDSSSTPGTYLLGGTSYGVSGSGLTLSLNGRAQVTGLPDNPTCGTFYFPEKLSKGQAYQVVVAGQPSNSFCGVFSGVGTVSSDVLNMGVSCSGTIGGQVTGLPVGNEGLVLQNLAPMFGQNPDRVQIYGGNTSYIFPQMLPIGATYKVGVLQQPQTGQCNMVGQVGGFVTGTVTGNMMQINVAC